MGTHGKETGTGVTDKWWSKQKQKVRKTKGEKRKEEKGLKKRVLFQVKGVIGSTWEG